MLALTTVAALDVSATSGLVAFTDRLCVVADDETFLSVYALDGTPRTRIPLLPHGLPDEHHERKRHKPDFEALALLPDGGVLAIGSGSTAARRRGALVNPEHTAPARVIDLHPLYAALERDVPDLNIEGAAVSGDALWLLQRGNGPARFNACIELDLARVLASLYARASIDADALRSIAPVALGDLDGVPLSFTDAVALPDVGLVFSAAAEDTPDTYADGPCVGSIVGVLTGARVTHRVRVNPACKIEGVALVAGSAETARAALWLVADPDDRRQRASLYRAELAFG